MKENHEKINPWEVPLEVLKSYIDKCETMLGKKLFPDVRLRTEQSLETLRAILQTRLDQIEIEPAEYLKGVAKDIETEWLTKEYSGFSGMVQVIQRDGEFFAIMNFDGELEEFRESTIIRRITATLANFEASKKHKLGLSDQIITGRGFESLTNYVQALRFVKYNKCQVYNLKFEELSIVDVFKFSKPSKAKKMYLSTAIERAINQIPV